MGAAGSCCKDTKKKKISGNVKSVSTIEIKKKVNMANKLKALNVSDMRISKFDGQMFAIDRLKTVNAQNCAVQGFVNPEKFFCATITKMNFSRNQLTCIPVELRLCVNLQVLNLADNKLKSFGVPLCNLRELYLSKNSIDDWLKLELPLEQLRVLDLSDNQIKRLEPSIFAAKNLEHVSLANNRLTQFDDIKTNLTSDKYMAIATTLKHLDLSNNRQIQTVQNLPRAFFADSCINNLNLSGTGVTKKMLMDEMEHWGLEKY